MEFCKIEKSPNLYKTLYWWLAVSGISALSIICLLHNVALLSPDTGPGECVSLLPGIHAETRIQSVDQFGTKFNQCTLLSLSNIIGGSVCYWTLWTKGEKVENGEIEVNLTNRTESLHTLLTKNHQVLLNFPTSSLSNINYAAHVAMWELSSADLCHVWLAS